jgi:hypothetical protein
MVWPDKMTLLTLWGRIWHGHREQAAFRVIGIALSFGFVCGQRFEGFFATLFAVIFGFDMTFNRVSYSTRGHHRHESHSLLLILA